MVRDFSKLLLRAYNNEAESTVRGTKPHELPASKKRPEHARLRRWQARGGRSMPERPSGPHPAVCRPLCADQKAGAE